VNNLKSIKIKLLLYLIPVIMLIQIAAAVIIGYFTDQMMVDNTIADSKGTTVASQYVVEEIIEGIIREFEVLTLSPDIKEMNRDRYVDYIADVVKGSRGLLECAFVADLKGKAVLDTNQDTDISDRDYFVKAMREKKMQVSNAVVSKATGQPVFVVFLPVTDYDGKLIGGFGAGVQLYQLAERISNLKVGENGALFLVDGTGQTITHPNPDFIMNFKITDKQEGYTGLKEIADEMVKGNRGQDYFTRPDGSRMLMIHEPVKNTPNWSIGAIIPQTQIKAIGNRILNIIVISFVMIIVILVLLITLLGERFTGPLKDLAMTLNKIANYDLSLDENRKSKKYFAYKDELGQMANAVEKMQQNLIGLVKQMRSQALEINESAANLNSVSQEQLAASEELSSQAQTVDGNVQNTSSSIAEVSSGIQEVTSSAEEVSKNSQDLSSQVSETEEAVKNGQKELEKQSDKMRDVEEQNREATKLVTLVAEKANNVQEIVNTIASIAEQTNLLALNAAIEAARAGEAGKGFAVVADEIRKLAEESKKASSNIAEILNEIEEGSSDANEAVKRTLELYEDLVGSSRMVVDEFNKISENMNTVNMKVESLMGAAQEQSASSEEMAGAMDHSAQLTEEIAEQVSEMSKAIESQTLGAQQVSESAERLSALSQELDEAVEKFVL